MDQVRLAFKTENILGEGPCWDPKQARLWWFDIKQRQIHWLDNRSEHGKFNLLVRASVAAPMADGGLLIAAEDGLSKLDQDTGSLTRLLPAPAWPTGFRSNDGKVDAAGRLWWSAMDDDGGTRPGFVYRYGPDGNHEVIDGVHIANAMAFSPDGATFYLADSKLGYICAYTIAPETGELLSRREFAHLTDGSPDGAATDADGYLWVAIWGGWRIERYAPDGRLDRTVRVPVEQPACCIFGGPDLATLYITSAREDLSAEALATQPWAGSLLAFEPGVKGLPIPPLFR